MLSPLHIRPVPTRSTDRSRIATPTRGRFRSNPRPQTSLCIFVTPVPTRKSPGGLPPGLGPRAPRPAGKLLTTSSGRSGEKRSLESPWVLLFRASSARPENQDVPSEQNPQAPGLNILLRPRSCTGKSCSTVLHPSEVCLFLQISPPLNIELRRSYLCHLHKQHAEKALPEVLFITFRDQTAIHIGGRSAAIRGEPRTGPRSPQQVETYGQTLPNRAKPAFLTFLASLDMTTKSDRRVATGQAVRNSSTPLWLSIYGQP